MCRLMFSYCGLIYLRLTCFFLLVHCKDAIQDINYIPIDVESEVKHLEDKANQQMEKDKFCKQADIAFLDPVPENNAIKVIFKLQDKKFQDCFKYFKIIVERKRKIIKEVKVPYSPYRSEEISYRFENITCGIYEVIVQPCFEDRYCPPFRWRYKKSISVTDESDNSFLIVVIISCLLTPLTFGILFYAYKIVIPKLNYRNFGSKYSSVPEYKDIPLAICGDLTKERKSLRIYILYESDKGEMMKIKVNEFKFDILESKLLSFFNAIICRDVDCSLNIHFRTIDSELLGTACLDNVNNWLNNATKNRGKDGILQRCILVKSSKKMVENDIVENEIFSYVQDKVSKSLKIYDNLFIAQSDELPNGVSIYSEKLTKKNIQTIISSDSHHFHWLKFCFDICSEFIIPTARKNFEILFLEYVAEELDAFQNSVNCFRPLCKITC